MTDPQAIYTQAQADIDTIAKRTGMTTSEVAAKMLELRILPALKKLTKGELDNGQS